MRVKTYKHESLQEGIELIKRELGSDALILSTRSVNIRRRFSLFKRPGWEITAATEDRPRKGAEGADISAPSTSSRSRRSGKREKLDPISPLGLSASASGTAA